MKGFRLSLYWWCQLIGWGSAAIYWSYYALQNDLTLPWFTYNVLTSFLTGVGSTHLYKLLSHRYGWHLLPIGKLLPVMILGVLGLLAFYTLSGMLVCVSIYGVDVLGREMMLGMITGGVRYNAIWILAFHLYHYARRESKIEVEKARLENIAMKAQLHQLNTELNPHFLFNSLNSIKALILENPDSARKALVILSDMLRYSLNLSQRNRIRLVEELVQVEDYLKMEKIRFEERLSYQLDIAPESLKAIIPPLSLHNLVENAIKHGINKRVRGGRIELRSHIQTNQLYLEVKHPGQLQEDKGTGIGVKNLRERLQLMYGETATFSLQNVGDNEVIATLKIPLRYE